MYVSKEDKDENQLVNLRHLKFDIRKKPELARIMVVIECPRCMYQTPSKLRIKKSSQKEASLSRNI